MTLAALETTLRLYLNEAIALERIPGLRMLGTPLEELQRRANALAEELRKLEGLAAVTVVEDTAYVGGGSLPDQSMKSWVVEITPAKISDAVLAERLRTGTPSVLGRLRDGKVVFDLRTVFPHQQTMLVDAVKSATNMSI
jgi:L-seryl-tRNA(Ser) seleniumtransferase